MIHEDPGSATGHGLSDSCWELRKNITQLGTTGIQGLQTSSQGKTLPGVLSLRQAPLRWAGITPGTASGLLSSQGKGKVWEPQLQHGATTLSHPTHLHRWAVKEDTSQTLHKHLHLSSIPIQHQTMRDSPDPHGHKLTPGTGRGGKRV